MNEQESLIMINALLRRMKGQDIDDKKIGEASFAEKKQQFIDEFARATGGLHKILLGDFVHDSRWNWSVEPTDSFSWPWCAVYKMTDTSHQEKAFDKPPLVQRAIALFPTVRLEILLVGEFHSEYKDGLHTTPRLVLSVEANDDFDLSLLEELVSISKLDLKEIGEIVPIHFCTKDGASDEICRPKNHEQEFKKLAKKVRAFAKKEARQIGLDADDATIEGVSIAIHIDDETPLEVTQRCLDLMGLYYTGIIRAKEREAD